MSQPRAAPGPERISVAVVGASGYAGAELIRLVLGHRRVRLAGVYARRAAGSALADVFPQLRGRVSMAVEAFDPDRVTREAEVVFLALPHGHSGAAAAALRERGARVFDLSADFRLRDPDAYTAWYAGGKADGGHPAPALVGEAVYGLPELYRDELAGASLVACPGCYPTAALLAAAPLMSRKLVLPDVVVDAKSGASGAGRSPGLATHFPEAGEGIRPYKIAGAHRHTPEIEQELGQLFGGEVAVLFTPHLVPMSRGILACVYAHPTDPGRAELAYRHAFEETYADEPFVTVLPPGKLPDTAHVRGSNRAHVQVAYDPRSRRVLAMAAIDNLVKGASGQALQCMNLALGFEETDGLDGVGLFP